MDTSKPAWLKDDIYGLQPWIFSIWFTSLSVNKFIIFWYNSLVHDLLRFYDVSQLSGGGSRVVTLLCKRRIIAFDPYLNSWKGFKTGLEEMWLLLKASLRTKGWIHLKCISFLWPKSQLCDCHKNFVASANSLLILFLYIHLSVEDYFIF